LLPIFQDQWHLPLDKCFYEVGCVIDGHLMEDADQLCDDPLGHLQHAQRIHMVRIDLAPDVSDISAVSDLVQRDNHAQDLDSHGAQRRSLLF